MKSSIMYRWSVKVENVFAFCMFYGDGFNASTLASYKNEVSGFVKKENVGKLIAALVPFGKNKDLKMVTSKRYWKDYDKYHN